VSNGPYKLPALPGNLQINHPELLEKVAGEVLQDMLSRNLPYRQPVLDHIYEYIDQLKCPSISIQPEGISAVFFNVDPSQESIYILYRKRLETNISYQGFYPFGAPANNIPLLSLYCAIALSLEIQQQYGWDWCLPAILKKYPEFDLDDPCFTAEFQRFGFEVMGFSPVVWKPPYNIQYTS
jgi:hypothetical protein